MWWLQNAVGGRVRWVRGAGGSERPRWRFGEGEGRWVADEGKKRMSFDFYFVTSATDAE